MTFGARLRRLREEKGLRQEDLGLSLNVGKSTVSQWENDLRVPDTNTLLRLSQFFTVSIDYLLGNMLEKAPADTSTAGVRNLPILGKIRSRDPFWAEENFDGKLELLADVDADFVLEVKGNSMIGAGILEGDWVLCKECQVAKSGDIVVALQDNATGYSEATLNYYFENGKQPILRAANPNYTDIPIVTDYRLVARMVALVRKNVPDYQMYAIELPGKEEWIEVFELASGVGLTSGQVKEIVAGQIQIAKQLKK